MMCVAFLHLTYRHCLSKTSKNITLLEKENVLLKEDVLKQVTLGSHYNHKMSLVFSKYDFVATVYT